MTNKQELTEGDTSTIKRVVNIKGLRFKSINENFETRARPLPDLTKINYALNNVALAAEHRQFKEPLLRQTSELDIEGNFEIRKTNPIFETKTYAKSNSVPVDMSTYESIRDSSRTGLGNAQNLSKKVFICISITNARPMQYILKTSKN